MNVIQKENAGIKTVSIEVRVIKIDRKQMTLSVFRQLPRKHIIDIESYDAELLGEPWGLVNYFWEGCGERHKHQHLVWSENNVLYRACISSVRKQAPCFGPTKTVHFVGDEIGVEFVTGVEATHRDYGFCSGTLSLAEAKNCEGNLTIWNKRIDQLTMLDQLFIAT